MKNFCSSFVNEQIETENDFAPPPLTRNFNGTASTGEPSHCARNCSAVGPRSTAQMAASEGLSPSAMAPKVLMAAWFAREITPASSMSNAGQPAFSNAKKTSDFITTFHRSSQISADVPQSDFPGTATNAAGSNSTTENSLTAVSFRLSATKTFASGAYSASSCRQAPQGIGPPGARATTAMATKFLFPLVNAVNSATRSAQHVRP